MVDTGSGAPVQVVCGAPNARTGMKSVFSPPGTYIPGKKITLGDGVIRGVKSNGMLCSEAELELSDDHDGIIDLPADAPVGLRLYRPMPASTTGDRRQPHARTGRTPPAFPASPATWPPAGLRRAHDAGLYRALRGHDTDCIIQS